MLFRSVGSGIPRMEDLMKESGLPAPEYRTEGFFTIVLHKNRPTLPKNVGENVGENTKESLKGKAKREKEILENIRINPKISSAELAKILKVAERTIERDIARLRETNKIKRHGSDKGGEWIIL